MGCSVSTEINSLKRFKYLILNILSNEITEMECEAVNYLDFLNNINNWNRFGGTKWKYWAK